MKIAVVKTGGKQYVVKEKDRLKVEKINGETGDKIEFASLLVADGDNVSLGAPVLADKVEAKIVRQARSRKVLGVKFKNKTRQQKRFGHRQFLTEVEIVRV